MAYIERGQALYTQLANASREQITSGALPPGSPLPREAGMRTTYGVSRPTARAAVNALRAEGIVTVLHGKGSFVRHTTPTHHRTITRTSTPTSRGRQRPAAKAGQGAYIDSATEGWTVLEEPGHYRTDATPTPDDVLALRLPDATPLLVTHRTTRTHGGQPLALEITHLSADGAQLSYTLTATTQETTTGSGTDRSWSWPRTHLGSALNRAYDQRCGKGDRYA